MDTAKDQKDSKEELMLKEQEKILNLHELEQKLRYLKLTKVTKKNQDIVTGREDINQEVISCFN